MNQVQIEKPAVAAPAKSKAKPAAALSNAVMSNMVVAATTTAKTKEDRAAERAKRFPAAAKAEAKKAAAKASKAKGEKPAAKVKPVAVAVQDRRAVAGKPVYAIMGSGARPNAGARLFAHTHAALTMFGLFDPKAPPVPRNVVSSVMGSTAVTYHLAQGNFVDGPNSTLHLSQQGRTKFLARGIDGKLANAFLDLFLDGKPENAGIAKSSIFQIA